MPTLAKEHTEAGAKAFVKYYWDVVNYAQQSLDTAGLKALSNIQCSACNGGARAIDKIRQSGGRNVGGVMSTSNMKVTMLGGGSGPALARVTVDVTATKEVVSYPSPRPDDVYPAGTSTDTFTISETPEAWRVEIIEARQ